MNKYGYKIEELYAKVASIKNYWDIKDFFMINEKLRLEFD